MTIPKIPNSGPIWTDLKMDHPFPVREQTPSSGILNSSDLNDFKGFERLVNDPVKDLKENTNPLIISTSERCERV